MNSECHRILLVDDEPMLLRILRREIEQICKSATIVYALDAQSAIWQLRNTSISMVLTDLRMHGEDDAGWAVVDAAEAEGVRVAVLTNGDIDGVVHGDVPVRRKDRLGRKDIAALIEPALRLGRTE